MDVSNDGSESVDQFLARIASLSSRQTAEEAERSKRTEEELLQARKERQARRLERARSLSPSKTGPAASSRPRGEAAPKPTQSIEPPVALTPPLQSRTLGRSGSISPRQDRASFTGLDFSRPLPPPPPLTDDEPTLPSPSAHATTLSRSGTLSWNQRPLSRGGAVRSRPLSVASIPDLGPSAPSAAPQKAEDEMSRKDIAATLETRDPSWFRQTADRGVGSAAYRKNETDSDTKTGSASRGMRLPGMSNAAEDRSEEENGKPTPPSSPPKSAHALSSSQRQLSSSDLPRPRPVSMVSSSPSKSPALDMPTFKPLDLNTSFAVDTPGLGRTSSILSSSGRPPSPTKGLGGFVESAMMKRSDSVSKRWSVQASAGLKRGDSVASNRPAHLATVSGYTSGHSRGSSRDVRGSRDGHSSPLSSSRPVSGHGEPVIITKGRSLPRPEDDPVASPDAIPKQEAQAEAAKVSDLPPQTRPVTPPPSETILSRSPSKTIDPRRWSPTKASWLESALNKPPESPRAAKPEMPAWRLSMQRAKQEQSQPSEAGKDAWSKPVVATKALSTSSTKDSKTLENATANGVAVGLDSTKAGLEKSNSTATPSSDAIDAHKRNTSSTSTKEERPIVPAKRNLTPVQLGSSSTEKVISTSVTPLQAEQDTAKGLQNPTLREPKPGPKMPAPKPKPSTPPKPDFRASLKSRQAAPTGNNTTEPEFKAVFGKLKRAQTQNYVAPDELKDNITMGKAALNVTGGPQKTKRVDEFKESILQKKEAMKTGGGAIVRRPEATSPTEKHNDPVPEALARRMALQKTGTSSEKTESKRQNDMAGKPNILASEPRAVGGKPPLNGLGTKPSLVGSKPQVLHDKPVPARGEPLSQSERTSAPPTILASNPEKSDAAPATVLPPRSVSDVPARVSQQNPETRVAEPALLAESLSGVERPENSKLAARLNPALAGILSRSGSPKPPGDASSNGRGGMQVRDTHQNPRESTKEDPAELTHMTKARSKGPKRRAPKTAASSTASSKPISGQAATNSTSMSAKAVGSAESPLEPTAPLPRRSFAPKTSMSNPTTGLQNADVVVGEVQRSLPTTPAAGIEKPNLTEAKQSYPTLVKAELPTANIAKAAIATQSVNKPPPASQTGSESKPKPAVANKSAELRRVSNQGAPTGSVDLAPPPKPKTSADLRRESNSGTPAKPGTPKKVEVLPDPSKLVSSPPDSDGERKTTAISPAFAPTLPLTPNKSKLNTPKAPKPDITSSPKANGLGLQLGTGLRKLVAAPVLTPPPEPQPLAMRAVGSPRKFISPTTSSPSIRSRLESFFGVLPTAGEKVEFDAHAFLSAQNKTPEKPKTLSNQIWEVSGDGKKTPMPPQQEHILFEDCLYLCVHSMQLPSGSKLSEVYLWCGDEVPEAAVEDAQLFCRKVARENSAKLEVIKQGKESSEFFQALGGIVIVRRNKSSALYMVCGRRHLGHVAFDEVDLSADSLCTGLPFLISAKFGKLYLWKGRGSNPEDVGCARLIGMDLGLTGEIEEVSEGEEPASFWDSLPSGSSKRMLPQSSSGAGERDSHPPRLYRVEHDRPKSSGGLGGFWGLRASSPPKQSLKALVEEIAPFSQKDLDGHHIHILDVYRELYVLIGSFAKKPAEFVTAVQVAQEIAVLSSSVQDRPLLPSCYVVMGEPPQHIKSIFRKWTSQKSSRPAEQSCLRVEEVVQELGIPL
ncbi:hypothetical protein A1O7_08371 [Cladophialophora yegresii CBS 114405]|uniref:Uncharacterized protein n=1 Tax=Cladophialophora yegresii CBS 114405 TaxID=1182544 RepID=W9WA54_9EURO|nr:uncharacterized protein A1O7_08371 [Cladophialophora yegresii CBS 114405]EXJ55444.1 hypothetical protein A1O7_08371 [Cladophialophora yegresii CBS 114405]